ncbi:MAG: hypothetical protein WD768_16275 [Phycisphaeraceae bacterium]
MFRTLAVFICAIPTGCASTKVTFFGVEDQAQSVVFVIDASGSLMDSATIVSRELLRSTDELGMRQSIGVFVCQQRRIDSVFADRALVPCTTQTRERLRAWLDHDLEPMGYPDGHLLAKAIHQAIDLEPEAIFIVSDHFRAGYNLIIQPFIDEANRARLKGIRIHTIQFLYRDPLEKIKGIKPIGKQMAEITGGQYRFVSPEEVGLK